MTEKTSDFISIIVLAAGLSTRFGRNKLLEPIGTSTMIEHVVSEAVKSKANQVIVVCGHDSARIKRELKDYRCEVVFNEDFEKGQSFSVRKGLSKVKKNADAVMVLPGDVALVDHSMINAVIDEYSTCYAPIVTAAYHGSFGHPILFDKNLFEELANIKEETRGLKSVVSGHRPQVRLVETSEAALLDVDKQDDLARLAAVSSGAAEA
ncbi:MAG: nucleotidyltransferase family protein [Nitrososphaerales archaeon]|jgi:molybdenum cofactor cytidylyltransferase